MFLIQSVHQKPIDEQKSQEADDGTLLSHPKTKGGSTNIWQQGVKQFAE